VSIARLLTDRVIVERPTSVETPTGYRDEFSDVPGDPIPCKLQLTSTYENVGGRDTVAGFRTCTMLGHPDIRPDDVLRDQHGRRFPIEGELDFTGTSRKPFTIARLRSAEDL
jgi:hypothetical protein